MRREQKIELVEKAQIAGIPDGIFWLVNYNKHGRLIGPNPSGEIISLTEVFPNESHEMLKEVESQALSLYKSANEICSKIYDKDFAPLKLLQNKFPQFGRDTYSSVISHANYMAIK